MWPLTSSSTFWILQLWRERSRETDEGRGGGCRARGLQNSVNVFKESYLGEIWVKSRPCMPKKNKVKRYRNWVGRNSTRWIWVVLDDFGISSGGEPGIDFLGRELWKTIPLWYPQCLNSQLMVFDLRRRIPITMT